MNDVIRTAGLTKYYGRRRGLDGLDLEVRQGEIYGFEGGWAGTDVEDAHILYASVPNDLDQLPRCR